MLNARYVPIGISVASSFDGLGARSGSLQSQLVVDESWAVALNRRGGFDVRVLLGAGGLLYLAWNAGTVVGVLLGNVDRRREPPRPRRRVPGALPRAAGPQLIEPPQARRGAARRRDRARADPVHPGRRADRRRRRPRASSAGGASERRLALRDRRRRGDDRVQGDRPGAPRPRPRAARRGWPGRCRTSPRPCSPPSSSRRPSPATARSSSTRGSPASPPARSRSPPRAAARGRRRRGDRSARPAVSPVGANRHRSAQTRDATLGSLAGRGRGRPHPGWGLAWGASAGVSPCRAR